MNLICFLRSNLILSCLGGGGKPAISLHGNKSGDALTKPSADLKGSSHQALLSTAWPSWPFLFKMQNTSSPFNPAFQCSQVILASPASFQDLCIILQTGCLKQNSGTHLSEVKNTCVEFLNQKTKKG